MPSYGTFSTLAGFAARYRNHRYIADLLAPVVEVDANSQYYYEFGKSDDFDEYETRTTEEGSVTESKSQRSQKSFTAFDYAHSEFLPLKAEEEAQLLGISDIQAIIERVTDVVLRKRERAVASVLFAAANYIGMTAAPAVKWGSATVAQISKDINDGKDAMTGPSGAELFQVDEVVIGEAQVNSAKKTETSSPTRARIWGDSALLCYRSATPTQMGATGHAVTFRRRVGGQGLAVYSIPEPRRGAHGGTLIKVAMTELPAKIVNDGQGYLLTAISA